jgi:Dynamin family
VSAPTAPAGLMEPLERLRDELTAAELGAELSGAEAARHGRRELIDQIDDYLLPRLRQMDAPLLMVVGGSTGAGKSTLVNSLVGATVSPAGVLRPTTRAPVLVCHPDDVGWFEGDRVLPGMSRSSGGAGAQGDLHLHPTDALPAGLALLDSPDVDSVVEANRALAKQLLAAADAWLFVTTAARYADAVPWDLLHAARDRGTALCLALNRVPPGAGPEVAGHLREMLAEQGVGTTELLVVGETTLEDGLLPGADLEPVRAWLDGLTADAQARADLVRRTLGGALDSLGPRTETVAATVEEQRAAVDALREDLDAAYAQAVAEVDAAVRDGSLLRGEVLARWHDVVGTGDVMRSLETRIGWLRDRLRSLATGAPRADADIRSAVETSLDPVIHAAADHAAERAAASWRQRPAGRALLAGYRGVDAASPALVERARKEVRAWQGEVFELVRREGMGRRSTARLASLGVNGAGLTVMLAVFVSTGGLTGAEVVIAGGTSALGQKVLEAVFGDQAVRSLAAKARADLLERVQGLMDREAARFGALLEPVTPDPERAARLRAALAEVERAR